MTHSKSNTTFIIFKAYSEENDPIDPYINILKNEGYEANLVPTLEFEYHNFDVLNHKLQKPQDYSGMVITSPRCVRGIVKCLADSKLDENWHKKPMFVVGETTSRLVNKELGFEPIGADSGNAMALIPIILKYELSKPLLAPCGNLNLNILSDNIKTVKFENIEVYRTIPHNNLKTNLNMLLSQIKNQIGVIFFSPSGFRAILDLMPKQLFSQLHIFAIGPTTGAAIKEAGFILTGACEKPKPESMLEMIQSFIK
ncbi:uroporphyrinogen-III synthase-like [Rhopalosiphum padi]|uniref:uroporphyrinogen-III synthase-like n=1 Tax=Rhopalosiphum padi TaxID=40932 RepID=UPI00298EAB38|nr:uroporphyrinogen-III synthase-like [Rhopalosiphum padi]XP_060851561.1 uroporphyrinogen-III synthase-like [Rhopalosiphum padi]